MTHNCYNCSNLDTKKKKNGKRDGCLYFCKKNKCFVNAAKDGCPKWSKADRKKTEIDEIYNNGKRFYDDDKSIGFYLFIFILIIIFIIFSLLNQ